MVNQRSQTSISLARGALVAAAALIVSGCASISIPFADVYSDTPDPIQTASIDEPVAEPVVEQPLPAELTAVAPIATPEPVAEPVARPMDDLIASIPTQRNNRVSLSQADLNAMGAALTHVLSTDADAGTFSWSHEATGRQGLMTPFRALSSTDQGPCRVVSVEITDNENDKILLADACQQDGAWVFVTPRAGQAL